MKTEEVKSLYQRGKTSLEELENHSAFEKKWQGTFALKIALNVVKN